MEQENQTQESTEVQETQEREYSPMEIKAIEQGWIPKEEFDGDESEFIDAPEFVRRGELFRKIETQSKELKAVRQALEAFKTHHSKVKEAEYTRALKTLQDARKQAFVDGDTERAFALEDKIEEIKTEKAQVVEDANRAVPDQDEGYTAEFQSWVDRNNWYETNKVMRKTADALGVDLAREGYPPHKVLEMVEAEIKKEFAHKFTGSATKRPMAVEASSRSGTRAESFSMTPEEEVIMRKIVNTGIMTKEQYIKDLKATRK